MTSQNQTCCKLTCYLGHRLLVRYPEVRQKTSMAFAEEHLREDMETLVEGEAKQCTSQSEFIPLSLWTQFQYWMPSSDSPEYISNGVNPQVRPKYGGR
ncbi:hypothetical protein AVEN_24745-1 [Araneus ventricosus]|uniref:Uncharacterized protein n=1 Tax=Araneus ventricosus TaxID=182803 RepID=A0A4Y2Q7J1_ARAVE|nr:hypothetical protein AVEN_24745-1 [Araneus ventricosus]